MSRLIVVFLAVMLVSSCCTQDPFSAGYRVIGFDDGKVKTIASNIIFTDDMSKDERLQMQDNLVIKIFPYVMEYCNDTKCLLMFWQDKKHTPLTIKLTDANINNMLMLIWAVKEDGKEGLNSTWLHNCKYITNLQNDCITVDKTRGILALFGYQ